MSGDLREDGPGTDAPGADRRWLFGACVFDEGALELRVNDQPVALERKSLEVLRQLLYHAGEVVTKDELMESVWPGRFLSETVIAKAISRIRSVIGDDDELIIKTQRGYGYRFVATVTVEAVRAAAPPKLSLKAGDHPPLRPQWRLVEQIGAGGQGEIWLVRHDKLPEQRVYKFALDSGGLAAIKREITLYRFLLGTLGARDEFVKVLDWNLEEAPYFIELEHAAAGNLETWAQAQGGLDQIPVAARLEIAAKIADALAAAHAVGVLHKDLKPSNVLIGSHPSRPPVHPERHSPSHPERHSPSHPERHSPSHPERSEGSTFSSNPSEILRSAQNDEGSTQYDKIRIKLSDFGSGGVLDPRKLEAAGITQLGFTRTTPTDEAGATHLYLAPEVLTGQPATVLADVYSLGVVLYQLVVADFRKPLSPGWELDVTDPLLREDIAEAVAGDPSRRLRDVAALATRIRSLDARRRERAAQEVDRQRVEREKEEARARARMAELEVAKLRARRRWMFTALSILIVGVSVAIGLFLEARRARNEAAAAAHTSQTVADFLSKDLFAVVGNKPLRDLTVKELLDSAAVNLEKREKEMPEAATQIHAALGSAFFTMLAFDHAEKHLQAALEGYGRSEGSASAGAISAASQLVVTEGLLGKLQPELPRYEALLREARATLGDRHQAVLSFANSLGQATYYLGHWRSVQATFETLLPEARTIPAVDSSMLSTAERVLTMAHLRVGDFESAEKVAGDSIQRIDASGEGSTLEAAQAHVAMGAVLAEREKFEAAELEFRLARRLTQPWVPDEKSAHLVTIDYYYGAMLVRAGRFAEAIATLERVVGDVSALSWNQRGSDFSPEIVAHLAEAYAAVGQLGQARVAIARAVAGQEKTFGSSHPATQYVRIKQAEILQRSGRPSEARVALAAVDRKAIRELGWDHPYAADLHRVEGLIAIDEGNLSGARNALEEAIRIYHARYGIKHSFSQRTRLELSALEAAPRK